MRTLLTIIFSCLSLIAIAREAQYFESVAEMTNSSTLQAGDVAITKGFYTANDGGGASYNIVSTPSNLGKYPADGWSLIALKNKGLYADILNGDDVSLCQLGAIPMKGLPTWATEHENCTHDNPNFRDCHDNLIAYVNLCKRRNQIYQLTCPAGHYFTSPAFMVIGSNKGIRVKGASPKDYGHNNETVFHAWEKGQPYIWTISGSEQLCHKDYPYIEASGVNITNISFSGQHGAGNYPQNQYSPIAALIAVGMCNSNLDALNFAYIGGSAMVLCNTQETVFGFISVGACGAFYKGRVMPCIWYAKIMGKDGFARKILGRTDEDYKGYKSRRNCSANYINYIDAEGIGGSIIHADHDAIFTHSEIGNIQWEGSFCDFSNMRNRGYDFIKSDGQKDYSYDENIRKEQYPNEKTVLCGAFSGWGHDITIHCITHTWNPMGYLAWYGDTMYRVRKVAAIVLNKEDMDKYNNVHLIDYNYRQPFPVCWIERPEKGDMHNRVFSLDTPLLPNSKLIRCFDGVTTPSFSLAREMPHDIYYPAIANGSYACCHYDDESIAPVHLTAYSPSGNGVFTMNYRANRHYFARVKAKHSTQHPKGKDGNYVAIYITYKENGKDKNLLFHTPITKLGKFCYIDLDFGNAHIDDNSPLKIHLGGLGGSTSMIWDCIKEMDTAPLYASSAPISDYNWKGRLWFDTQAKQLKECKAIKQPALYRLTIRQNKAIKAGIIALQIEDQEVALTIDSTDIQKVTDDISLTKLLADKLTQQHYAVLTNKNTLCLSGLTNKENELPKVSKNEPGCSIKAEIIRKAVTRDYWE